MMLFSHHPKHDGEKKKERRDEIHTIMVGLSGLEPETGEV